MYKKYRKSKVIVTLGILLIFLPLFIQSSTEFKPIQFNEKNGTKRLKTSGVYTGILVDDLLTSNTTTAGNWTWAINQPWCSGSGTLLDPYIIEGHIWNITLGTVGLNISNSHNKYFIIRNCTFKWDELTNGMPMTGIYLLNTTHGLITDNLVYHLGYGILLENCENINIKGNTIYDHIDGISLVDSDLNSIIGNIVNNNTENGIHLYSFSDSNNITENTASGNNNGIYLEDDCMNNTISGNIANNNNGYGVYLYTNCDYNTISNNTINDNHYSGISLEYGCHENIISGNTINNSTNYGIYLYDDCSYTTISNNFVNASGDYGITLHWYSQNNTIKDNNANYNGDIGIELYDYCENNTVSNNVISYNGLNGIGIYDFSDSNILTENLLYNNTIGLYIDNGDNNSIYNNFFAKNYKHAFDDGIENKWNNTIIGNYWDNHTGPDISPQDGIVDNPYTFIDGPAGSIDYLPIAEDGAPRITIKSPIEGEKFGINAPTFNVEIIDVYIFEMWYTLDGGLTNITFTENGTINQAAWNALPEESVTITFYAIDIVGNEAFEEVIVTKSISAGGLDPGVIAAIVVVSVIGGLVIVGVILRILLKKGKISLEKLKNLSFRKK